MRLVLVMVLAGGCAMHERPVAVVAAVSVSVGEPSPFTVSSMPPEPLYEQMTPSPGYGQVWIDGSWHWNGSEWVWIDGRWDREQPGLVYVQPATSYVAARYLYTPGYWARPDRVPSTWLRRDGRDGRPAQATPTRAEPVRIEPAPTRSPSVSAPSVPRSAPSRSSRERR
jgi:hypothetical protein